MRYSIVIRTLNEARHLGDLLQMIALQDVPAAEVEVLVIDSGSTDATLAIAARHGCRISHIAKSDFSFGRSLNRAAALATGAVLVFISGHCVPVRRDWLRLLCAPVLAGQVAYAYGRQIGDDDSNYSERRIFAKYFPPTSRVPQEGFFCNNANAALAQSVWQDHPFDEDLTGLEDMDLGRRLAAAGLDLGYVAEAGVYHHHAETWAAVRRRFEREAIALRVIMPEVHLSRLDVLRFVVSSVAGDWASARQNGVTGPGAGLARIARYRYNQYIGSFLGNREHSKLSQAAKERFFYPAPTEKAPNDDWLKPHRRTPPHEGQQPAGEGQELPSAARKTPVSLGS
jgi:rhamnosyltransferase